MPVSQACSIFTADLTARHLSNTDHEFYLNKGKNLIETFLHSVEFDNNQVVEQKITVKLEDMTLTGNLDLLQIDKKAKTITVFDYKTGAPFDKFDSGTKFKTHGYKQQLMFYKLLLDNTPEYTGYKIEQGIIHFVEPIDGSIKTICLHYSESDIEEFTNLIKIIWKHIQNLNFPDVSKYEKNLRGSMQFEKDLISEVIL